MAEKKEEKKEAKKELSPEDDAAKSKKKRLLMIIAGGGLLVATAAGGAFYMLASGGKDPGKGHEKAGEGDRPNEQSDHSEAADKAKGSESKGETGEKGAEGDKKKDESSKQNSDGKSKDGASDGKEAPKKDEKKTSDKDDKDKKIDGVDFGCTMPLGPFHLNLGNPLENRYIRIDLAVEYGCAEEHKAELEKRAPQLKNAVIAVTSRKTREFLLGPDGKEQLRKEILNRVNHFMTKKVEDIYITEIIIE